MIADFAELFVYTPDEAQGFHWNNSQVTIHLFVVYYTESSGELHQLSLLLSISDCFHCCICI